MALKSSPNCYESSNLVPLVLVNNVERERERGRGGRHSSLFCPTSSLTVIVSQQNAAGIRLANERLRVKLDYKAGIRHINECFKVKLNYNAGIRHINAVFIVELEFATSMSAI